MSVSEAKDQDADKSQSPVDLAPHRTGLATPTPVILDEEPENAATQQDRDTGDQRDESLVTDSSGHQDAALSAEQLAERAVQLVAAREGVSTSYLEVIDSTRPRWRLINKSAFAFKVLDHANVRIYGITLGAGGQELDISRRDAEQEAARNSKYGKLSPFLLTD